MHFMADVECIQSWDRAAAAAEEAEPGLMSDTITPHPSDTAGVAITLASYVVGDGDKGIAEAFGKFLKRCQRHRSKNVATFKGSKKVRPVLLLHLHAVLSYMQLRECIW